ncbi:MAG TPA: hypothetical protein VHT96_09105 [Clostridia bacterium]|nr:hypothetical protein [Clostridia bacterium]
MFFLKIFAGLIMIAGFFIALAARGLVTKFSLDQRVKVENESEFDEKDAQEYRYAKAVAIVKMCGMIIALPGLILTLFAFK